MKRTINISRTFGAGMLGTALGIALLATASVANAQTFDPYQGYPALHQKAGQDGTLDLTGVPANTVVDFDPSGRSPKSHPSIVGKDADKDNIFHFSRIIIPANVTLRLSAQWTNGPVYFLVSPTCGPNENPCLGVNILGHIELGGNHGHNRTKSTTERVPAIPGPGGFPGGLGGNHRTGSGLLKGPAQPGAGPYGRRGGFVSDSWGLPPSSVPGSSPFVTPGNEFLVPLVGGSGGGGGSSDEYDAWGTGGGAGGGAILIASAKVMHVQYPGGIYANGGAGGSYVTSGGCPGYLGAGGGGGSIRLMAQRLQGDGHLHASYNYGNMNNCNHPALNGIYGRVRLEAYEQAWGYRLTPYYTTGAPLSAFLPPTAPPTIQVVSVNNQAVRADPTGGFDSADVTIDTLSPVTIQIRATNVPIDTRPKLYLFSMDGNDKEILAPPLQPTTQGGGAEDTTCTLQGTEAVAFPSGFTRGYVRASWTVQP